MGVVNERADLPSRALARRAWWLADIDGKGVRGSISGNTWLRASGARRLLVSAM